MRREHPGQLIRRNVLDRHGLSIGDAARLLGVPKRTLLDLLTGKASLSPELTERIEAVFGAARQPRRRGRWENKSDLSTTSGGPDQGAPVRRAVRAIRQSQSALRRRR